MRAHHTMRSSGRARARARAMNPNMRLFGLVGRGGCDGPLLPTRARSIRTLTTLLVRRGGHVRCVWWYGAYSVTRHGSRGSPSAGFVWSSQGAFLVILNSAGNQRKRLIRDNYEHVHYSLVRTTT